MIVRISAERIALGAIGIIIVCAGVGMGLAHHHSPTKASNLPTKNVKTTTQTTKQTTPSTTTQTSPASNTSAGDSTADSVNTTPKPVTAACSLLTLTVAKQLLGNGATSSTPSDTSSMQATDTSLSACAYASGSSTLQLVIRTPTSSLGTSENDTVFGSGRPTNTTAVQGYGQSAYWDPSNASLDVLGSNNWYVITTSSGSESNAEAAAKLLQSGF